MMSDKHSSILVRIFNSKYCTCAEWVRVLPLVSFFLFLALIVLLYLLRYCNFE